MSRNLSAELRHVFHRVAADVSLHAVVAGSGPAVFLIHGWPQTWYEWTPVIDQLAEHHTVVAVDLKGAGNSSKPMTGYDKVTMAAELDALREALGFETVQVIGHDFGGMVAYAWAATHREAVTRLGIFDVPIPGADLWDTIYADPTVWHFSFHRNPDLPEFLITGREYGYVESFFRGRTSNHGAFTDDDVELYARALAQPGAIRSTLGWYRALEQDAEDNRKFKQEPLTIPVLALGGADRWGPKIAEMVSEFATDVTGVSIPECGHWVVEERPDVVLDALANFLER
ncbi:alpha/beta hydrolase [Nocardia sp. NPDC050799]|uniref:alpha/beta fold hydrolase n=1 Tax=Nocardia sp. NPDC050799 TaxID=3154842 RepID=UPI00340AD124